MTKTRLNSPSILQTYSDLIEASPPQQPALAAITALTTALTQHHFSTATEVLSLLDNLAKELKSQVADPIPLSAGTDLFLHYLINEFARSRGETTEFERTTEDVQAVGQRFVQRGLRARSTIKKYGKQLIRDGMTVIIPEIDELSMGMVVDAAEADVDFRVVFAGGTRCENVGKSLSTLDIRWTIIPQEEVMSTMIALGAGWENAPNSNAYAAPPGETIVLASAAAILSTGGIWSSPVVMQTATLAKDLHLRVVVPSEMLKLVKCSPREKREPWLQWRQNGDSTPGTKVDSTARRMDVTVSI